MNLFVALSSRPAGSANIVAYPDGCDDSQHFRIIHLAAPRGSHRETLISTPLFFATFLHFIHYWILAWARNPTSSMMIKLIVKSLKFRMYSDYKVIQNMR